MKKMSDDYKRGYREGFKDGFSAGKDTPGGLNETIKVNPYPSVKASGCSVCGMEFKGVFSYVCHRLDCPSSIVAL